MGLMKQDFRERHEYYPGRLGWDQRGMGRMEGACS